MQLSTDIQSPKLSYPTGLLLPCSSSVGTLTLVKNVNGISNVAFKNPELLWLDGQDTAHVHVTYLVPIVFTESGRLHKPAILAPQFDDTAAPGQPCVVVALPGDIPFGPQPESTVYLYIMSILSAICKEQLTDVALRTRAA